MLALLRDSPMTLRDLVTRFALPLGDTARELQHVARSAAPERLVIEEPSRCQRCGHVFADRRRYTTPSRCPRCRSEKTTEPVLRISCRAGSRG